jgi:outer membrane receptor protein involved in Fe transport
MNRCRSRGLRNVVFAGIAVLLLAGPAAAQEGTIEGRVRLDGRGVANVTAEIAVLGVSVETDAEGRYRFTVAPGTYEITLRLAGFEAVARDVRVVPDQRASVDTDVTWPLFRVEAVTVSSPERLPKRLLEVSTATAAIQGPEMDLQSTHGQLPRALTSSPGVEVIQSGLYDFNVNARGFNTAINRHIKTIIDGRDPSDPVFLGYQDWAANSMPLDDVDRMEFTRGPGAALYGAGAFNGVLSIVTKTPRDNPGGFARVAFGGLDTKRVEVRHAASMGPNTYIKVTGGYHQSRDFTQSRVNGVEYASGLLPQEVIPPPRDHVDIAFGTVRLDTTVRRDRQVVAEFGISSVRGLTTLTSVGRTQAAENRRPWARGSVSSSHWSVSAYYTGQSSDEQTSLSTGVPISLNAHNVEVEFVGRSTVGGGRGRLVAGASFGSQHVDSANAQGIQTALSSPQSIERGAGFGEVDYRLADRVRVVAAARVDKSDLHDVQLSPRGAVVFNLSASQRLRVSASRGFQSPSAVEFFLSTAVAPPVDLSALETALSPLLNGTPLGFRSIPVLAVGNEHLKVERVAGFEVGYSGVLGRRAYVTLDYYRSRVRDFTSNLFPQVGTPLGRTNPSFGPYMPPAALAPGAAAAVQFALAAALPPSLLAVMSNDAAGAPVFVPLSFRNIGDATTQGLESAVSVDLGRGVRADASYNLFDHTFADELASAFVSPNTAPHRFAGAATIDVKRTQVMLRYRWVDGFDWASGLFVGPVPSYHVTDLQASYAISPRVRVGVDVANLFNQAHYEIFGGDLLRRRALVSAGYSW